VCALQWSKHSRELVSSHGFSQNQLIVWNYPSVRRSSLSLSLTPPLRHTHTHTTHATRHSPVLNDALTPARPSIRPPHTVVHPTNPTNR
jgi:hypothetical protein